MSNKSILAAFPATIQADEELTQKQKDVLIASIRLFAEQGYANTSTHQIAVAAHQSEGTMFKHFKSKANILRTALAPVITQIIPKLSTELIEKTQAPIPDLHAFLTLLVRDRMAFAAANQDAIKVFLSEILYNEALRQDFIAAARQELITTFQAAVLDLRKRGLIVDWPFSEIFRFIVAVVLGYIIDRYILFPDRDWDDDHEAHYLVLELEKVLRPEP
ncbi:TetR/AcrR family transcriptional regulator [Levilactobacillus tangyuanensis]|uniref:TetR/AcrR family transcriptional regulator n=1 Tax=Levilactobacillus tangyuanensis TaxID=2486021 RepID=A0ABW1TK88_9LACO|nr:TetR/AcrR family transcriptional regulator [Levilactobacillus tangyuanensis]